MRPRTLAEAALSTPSRSGRITGRQTSVGRRISEGSAVAVAAAILEVEEVATSAVGAATGDHPHRRVLQCMLQEAAFRASSRGVVP
jgi:hypothetical protein